MVKNCPLIGEMNQAWRRANDNYYLAGSLGLNTETLLTRHVPCWNTGHYARGTVTRDKKLHREFLSQGGHHIQLCPLVLLHAHCLLGKGMSTQAWAWAILRTPDEETTHCCPACSLYFLYYTLRSQHCQVATYSHHMCLPMRSSCVFHIHYMCLPNWSPLLVAKEWCCNPQPPLSTVFFFFPSVKRV